MAKKNLAEKAEKTEKTDKSSSSANVEKVQPEKSTESVEDADLGEPEAYVPVGVFETDFNELCKRMGFPEIPILVRPHAPVIPQISPQESQVPSKTDKRGEDKKDDKDKISVEGSVTPTGDGQDVEPPPTTYTTKDKFQFFKPRIEVEMEDEGNKGVIREFYIRGWTIDDRMMNILRVTLPSLEKLATIDLWNTGLTDETFNVFATEILPHLPNLKTLKLDGNPLILQRYDKLLSEESSIQHLYLKNCYVNNQGAKHIGQALSTNKSLQTLNLCFNKITCEGAECLAKGLRMNRTLLSLNLGSNLIENTGASKFAEVISRFSLSHEEIVARRVLRSKKSAEDAPTSPTRGLNAPKGDRPGSVRSGTHMSKGEDRGKSRERDKGKKKEGKKDDKPAKKSTSTENVKAAGKGKKGATSSKGDKKSAVQQEQEAPEVLEFPNPLLETVEEIRGELYIPGNRALINLNLARNKIGEDGVKAFVIAIQHQTHLANLSPRAAGGMMRLTLMKNDISQENGSYSRLIELMQTRDPFYKPPQPSPIDGDITPIKEDA